MTRALHSAARLSVFAWLPSDAVRAVLSAVLRYQSAAEYWQLTRPTSGRRAGNEVAMQRIRDEYTESQWRHTPRQRLTPRCRHNTQRGTCSVQARLLRSLLRVAHCARVGLLSERVADVMGRVVLDLLAANQLDSPLLSKVRSDSRLPLRPHCNERATRRATTAHNTASLTHSLTLPAVLCHYSCTARTLALSRRPSTRKPPQQSHRSAHTQRLPIFSPRADAGSGQADRCYC